MEGGGRGIKKCCAKPKPISQSPQGTPLVPEWSLMSLSYFSDTSIPRTEQRSRKTGQLLSNQYTINS